MNPEPTGQQAGPEQTATDHPARPHDVETGFWLWAAALPLMVIGYPIGAVVVPGTGRSLLVVSFSVLFVLVLAAIVVTCMVLMRHGYRWARTVLTGGGLASIVNAAINLFEMDLPPVAATGYAAAAIFGSVLIAGGIYLLHRKDAHAFFTR